MEPSEIQAFYKNCNVFITGGTGFLGKILIEKLLRSTEISTIYILVREKKGKNVHTRIDELFDDVVFQRLKKECPKFKHRVEAVPGDCAITGLGLSIDDRQKLITKIHVVFHVAATVRFDENLKLAYDINVNGIRDTIDIAKQMKQLKSIVHVSTAYSNCHLTEIAEVFYECPIQYEQVGKLLEKLDKSEAEELTPRIIGNWPNTYTFTKALAESLVRTTGPTLPIGIFRPAIVISTYKEPIEGWIDNFYGPTGVCAGSITGIMRVMHCNKQALADVVPVDTCVAGLIAAAWDIGKRTCDKNADNIPIYNYVSSPENPITWDEFVALNSIHGKRYPVKSALWVGGTIVVENQVLYTILTLLLHTIPAVFIDFFLLVLGHRPRMQKVYQKIHKLSDILTFFANRSWNFSNHNVVNLYEKLNSTDRQLFPFSIRNVHWTQYFKLYIRGLRLHLLKDNEGSLEEARRKRQRFYNIDLVLRIVIQFLAVFALWTVLTKVLSAAHEVLWHS